MPELPLVDTRLIQAALEGDTRNRTSEREFESYGNASAIAAYVDPDVVEASCGEEMEDGFAGVADQKRIALVDGDGSRQRRLGDDTALQYEFDRRDWQPDVVGDIRASRRRGRQQDSRNCRSGEPWPPKPAAKATRQNECLTRNSSA